jgi:DNA-binding LacI/PurR family transcriptional regulator
LQQEESHLRHRLKHPVFGLLADIAVARQHPRHGRLRYPRALSDRVFKAVAESGYRPNLLARNLATKTTQTLGLVVTRDTVAFDTPARLATSSIVAM